MVGNCCTDVACCEIFVKVALAFSVALVLDLDQGICASKWLILILVWNLHPYLGLCGKILAGLLQCVWSFYVMTMVSWIEIVNIVFCEATVTTASLNIKT